MNFNTIPEALQDLKQGKIIHPEAAISADGAA